MRCAPAKSVRACFVRSCCSVLLSKNMTRARPWCNATPSENFPHTSHCALHTAHLQFTLHTSSHLRSCEPFSPHLNSSHLIPSLLTCHLSKFFSAAIDNSLTHAAAETSSKIISPAPKLWKSSDISLSQPWCSHSITIYEIQLQKTSKDISITHAAAAPSNLDTTTTMRSAETEYYAQRRLKLHLQNRISTPKRKKRRFWSTFQKDF